MPVKIFPPNPVRRLVDTKVPDASVADLTNPVVMRLRQITGFGVEGGCSPQAAGIKLRESLAAVPVPALIEHCAHTKSWIKHQLTALIDGKLPTIIRKFKYAADIIKIIQYAARVVATIRFLESILQKEMALAQAWANECDAMIQFAEDNLTPAGLRTQAEQELANSLNIAKQAIAQQVSENTQSLTCLI